MWNAMYSIHNETNTDDRPAQAAVKWTTSPPTDALAATKRYCEYSKHWLEFRGFDSAIVTLNSL